MRRLLALILLTMLAFPAGADAARGFVDEFTIFDTTRWTAGEHQLGRSWLDPANVSTDGAALSLALPGAEIRSTRTFSSGVFRARMRVADAPASLTGFFLYAPPDYASEIDIEVVQDTVLFSTYAGGRQTHTETRALGFDPAAGYHDYEIRWAKGRVTFAVDGQDLRTWSAGVPTAPMALYANTWLPTWLDGTVPPEPRATLIDAIEYIDSRK